MEEVDNIILASLADCGCDFAEDASSLAQFSTENVVEAAVRCLRIINPDLKLSPTLPPGMSARFRIGTTLAQACQAAGYREDIGYQTFLYSSESDIRKLFMFLVEKLPRKKDESSEQTAGKTSIQQQNIARVLKIQLSSLWLPPYCKKEGIRWLQKEFFIEGSKNQNQFRSEILIIPQGVGNTSNPPSKDLLSYYQEKLPYVDAQLSKSDYVIPSLIERNASELSKQYEWENIVNSGNLRSNASQEYQNRELSKLEHRITSGSEIMKDQVTSNGRIQIGGISLDSSFDEVINTISSQSVGQDSSLTVGIVTSDTKERKSSVVHKEDKEELINPPAQEKVEDLEIVDNQIQNNAEETRKESEEEKIQRIERELKTELRETIEKLESMERDIHNFQETIIKAKEDLRTYEQSNKTMQEKVRLQKKTLQLLPDAEENIAKLQVNIETYIVSVKSIQITAYLKEMVDANKRKMIALEQQWEKHRVPLQEKWDNLKLELSQKETLSDRKMKEVKLVRQRIKENTEELKRKEQLEKQLSTQCAEVTVDIPRKSYTKRIFEIVANIRKQKQEIGRVLIDVRNLQKEINQLEGRAERTFTAADDLFYQDAASNKEVRQVYKYLVSLNVNCSQLLDTVEQTGEVMREIRNLEEQVADESKKNTSANLEKITDDFKAMKKENADMMKKLKSLTAASPKKKK